MKYGVAATSTLNITSPISAYQIDMTTNLGATPISGANYLRSTQTGGVAGQSNYNYFYFNFDTNLEAVAFTINARNAARTGDILLTYNDASSDTFAFSVATATGSGATSTPDTFFGFQAPTGKSISGLTIRPAGGNFLPIDDLAFITVPEPSSALLGVIGALTLLRRRR